MLRLTTLNTITRPLSIIPSGISSRSLASGKKMSGKAPVIAIAGVTGAVGQELLDLIESRKFPYSDIIPLASKRSAGKKFTFMGKEYEIKELTEEVFTDPKKPIDIAFFSAGGSISKKFAPLAGRAKSQGIYKGDKCIVIDNSSAFRMTKNIPLVVPEINPSHINWLFSKDKKNEFDSMLIANPNCSTIIMNLAVYPLHKKQTVQRVVVSTYQAASGAGAEAMRELETQAKEFAQGKTGSELTQKVFGKQYIFNLFSHNSKIYLDNGYNEEEMKMLNETRKIFDNQEILVTATCVRVPVLRAHCESINVSFKGDGMSETDARAILNSSAGVSVIDDRENNKHPEPIFASGKDDIFVGRIRADISQPKNKGLDLFVAGDQIRKGAALNAIQIADILPRN